MPSFVKPEVVLLDIEGTTSSISFVHEVLFPYSAKMMVSFLESHGDDSKVKEIIVDVCKRNNFANNDTLKVADYFKGLISRDVKDPQLKVLQGMIWLQGYEDGDYQAHLYPEVAAKMKQWSDQGIKLYIYSSGSVGAQKLFFKYTVKGDLLPWIKGHFDLATGGKREAESYHTIAAQIGCDPVKILFLSDIREELEAARAAGYMTCQIRRSPTDQGRSFEPAVEEFTQIQFTGE